MFTSLDLDGNEQCAKDDTCPPAARVIAPKVTVADSSTDANLNGSDDGGDDDDRDTDHKLIDAVEIFHFLRNVMTTISGATPKRKGMTPPSPDETLMARSPI